MNLQFNETKKNLEGRTLDELCEEISVIDEWENKTTGLEGWFAVASDLGIIAYFGCEKEAYYFRLDYINRIMNT